MRKLWLLGALALALSAFLTSGCGKKVQPLSKGDSEIQQEAIIKMRGTGIVRHAEWLDDQLLLAVEDSGKTWEAIGDQTCSWLRYRGYTRPARVSFLEASALRNKRWKQLASVRCS
ncbi:hypothetical protein [Stenotrophomonas bentonitica]